jgi:hypothetical protein
MKKKLIFSVKMFLTYTDWLLNHPMMILPDALVEKRGKKPTIIVDLFIAFKQLWHHPR